MRAAMLPGLLVHSSRILAVVTRDGPHLGRDTMRALAAGTALFLIATPALAASPQVEAAAKMLQAIGSPTPPSWINSAK